MALDDEEKEANVYGADAREELGENDEISPEEEAFMEGYDSDEEEEDEFADEEYEQAFEEEEETTERFEEEI